MACKLIKKKSGGGMKFTCDVTGKNLFIPLEGTTFRHYKDLFTEAGKLSVEQGWKASDRMICKKRIWRNFCSENVWNRWYTYNSKWWKSDKDYLKFLIDTGITKSEAEKTMKARMKQEITGRELLSLTVEAFPDEKQHKNLEAKLKNYCMSLQAAMKSNSKIKLEEMIDFMQVKLEKLKSLIE